jgi:hypothetical protein
MFTEKYRNLTKNRPLTYCFYSKSEGEKVIKVSENQQFTTVDGFERTIH